MPKSSNYWRQREEENLKHNRLSEAEYQKAINETYEYMLDQIQKEINGFYAKYAKAEKISMAEAKRRVSKLDIEEYGRKAAKYVKEKDFSKQANEEMRLYNATMKINRLELLKANIGLELVSGFDELQKYFDEKLTDRTLAEFERLAGILGKSVQDNEKAAHAIVNASYKNATYSDRIWMYQGMLKNELDGLLKTGLIQGKHPRELARHLQKRFGVSAYNANRLMTTELARVQTEAQKQSFVRNGFTQYTFLALGTACSVCRALDDKHFDVDDMMPGENAPPMHPNCRCSVAAYMDDESYNEWLDTYKEHGMSYEEWKKNYWNTVAEKGTYIESIKRIGTNDVDLNYIKTEDFRKKFSKITDNTAVNDAIRKYATAMLTHRNGTDGEDLYIIDSKGELVLRKIAGKNELGVSITKKESLEIREKGKCIGIHNHPTNIPPTGSDFSASGYRRYDFGIVVTHSGRVYKYAVGNKAFLPGMLDARIDKYTNPPYNLSVEKAHIKALNEMVKEYDIAWQELE